MQNVENLLKLLPGSWDELKLKDYLKLFKVKVKETDDIDNQFVDMDNLLGTLSALTGVPENELEQFPLESVNRLATKILFIHQLPVDKKPKTRLKKIEELTYNDYVFFVSHAKDVWSVMPAIIKSFLKDDLTEEQINNFSMQEVHAIFFTLNKRLRKLTRSMLRHSRLALAKNIMRQAWKTILTKLKLAVRGER